MIRLTAEQAQQIEEALEDIVRVFKFETGTPVEALAVIRAARAQEQAEQEPEYKGWYCAHCERGVDGSEVTFHEQHEVCGRVITNDVPPKPVMQEPVAWQFFEDGKWWIGSEYNHHRQLTEEAGYPIRELYAAPVRTKDLTDGAIYEILETHPTDIIAAIRAVIAADREKNK